MKQHYENIGKTARLNLEGLPVEVTITNIRNAFGRVDYEVSLNGVSKWVNHERVEVLDNGRE